MSLDTLQIGRAWAVISAITERTEEHQVMERVVVALSATLAAAGVTLIMYAAWGP